MLYKDLELPTGIRSAIKKLEDAGMTVTTETLLQDCKRSDGTRFRTFTLSGRHDLCLIVRKVSDLKPIGEAPEKELVPGVNFWLDRSKWHRLRADEFYPLVMEECLDDLRASPVAVQADVHAKFDRLCDADDWPL